MRKLISALMLFTAIASPVFAEEEAVKEEAVNAESTTQTYYFYVVSHTSHDLWATTQDGSKNLWLKESDFDGQTLQTNDNFKATFDENGELLSVEEYVLE